jgi:NAD+ synthase (glutamine-hydrolysing)
MSAIKICLAQLNFKIGDFEGNTAKIADTIFTAKQKGADLVVFSEMSVCGYMPDDLLDYPWFVEKCEHSLDAVAQSCQGIAAIVGGVMRNPHKGRNLQNVMCFMQNGRIQKTIAKTLLPTYDVFNEARYFEPAQETDIIEFKGHKIGIAICEDIWDIYNDFEYKVSPGSILKELGADIIINPSASPFHLGKQSLRNRVFGGQASRFDLPVVYANQVGMHTELLFDGASRAVNRNGEVAMQLPDFEEAVGYISFDEGAIYSNATLPIELDEIATLHQALIFGIKDYFKKMGFKKAVLGSSGGIDSALVQALLSQALGNDNVLAILMPSQFSSEGSISDAKKISENLGNEYHILPIENIFDQFTNSLTSVFEGREFNVAEENIQARSRGVLLMAISNKLGNILINTSNKSEMAVGYSTLYGDMCGSLSILGDVYKTQVYALAKYINRNHEIIPNEIIEKAPSAELRPGQKDSDSLPDYDMLDEILKLYIEGKKSKDEITMEGYDSSLVERIVNMVNANEYKRYQAPPIIRVSSKAFGKGRIMPLVAKYQ